MTRGGGSPSGPRGAPAGTPDPTEPQRDSGSAAVRPRVAARAALRAPTADRPSVRPSGGSAPVRPGSRPLGVVSPDAARRSDAVRPRGVRTASRGTGVSARARPAVAAGTRAAAAGTRAQPRGHGPRRAPAPEGAAGTASRAQSSGARRHLRGQETPDGDLEGSQVCGPGPPRFRSRFAVQGRAPKTGSGARNGGFGSGEPGAAAPARLRAPQGHRPALHKSVPPEPQCPDLHTETRSQLSPLRPRDGPDLRLRGSPRTTVVARPRVSDRGVLEQSPSATPALAEERPGARAGAGLTRRETDAGRRAGASSPGGATAEGPRPLSGAAARPQAGRPGSRVLRDGWSAPRQRRRGGRHRAPQPPPPAPSCASLARPAAPGGEGPGQLPAPRGPESPPRFPLAAQAWLGRGAGTRRSCAPGASPSRAPASVFPRTRRSRVDAGRCASASFRLPQPQPRGPTRPNSRAREPSRGRERGRRSPRAGTVSPRPRRRPRCPRDARAASAATRVRKAGHRGAPAAHLRSRGWGWREAGVPRADLSPTCGLTPGRGGFPVGARSAPRGIRVDPPRRTAGPTGATSRERRLRRALRLTRAQSLPRGRRAESAEPRLWIAPALVGAGRAHWGHHSEDEAEEPVPPTASSAGDLGPRSRDPAQGVSRSPRKTRPRTGPQTRFSVGSSRLGAARPLLPEPERVVTTGGRGPGAPAGPRAASHARGAAPQPPRCPVGLPRLGGTVARCPRVSAAGQRGSRSATTRERGERRPDAPVLPAQTDSEHLVPQRSLAAGSPEARPVGLGMSPPSLSGTRRVHGDFGKRRHILSGISGDAEDDAGSMQAAL
ncbi:collagen alpha-1(I) chain-like [Mustela lutreola]|uniref:collagen alpha-1(I) chain-like n=1 Tax=Mustela lutreola TaxID=9666 RepID=UPI00279763DB|nr:collagen alpha-1(I) chain-like [Mustela lutreola]